MSDQEDSKAGQRDSDGGEERDSDTEIDGESKPTRAEAKRVSAKDQTGAKRATSSTKSASMPTSNVALFVVLALAVGGVGGWFGHVQQAKAALKADSVTPAGSSSSGVPAGPCGAWQQKLCSGAGGEQAAACLQAKGATELLTPSICEAALVALPATLNKLKAARASCDQLVSKLCADLPAGSKMCEMVKERTPSFPAKRCEEMLKRYEEVLGELKQMDQQSGAQPGGPGGPGPVMPPH